MTSRSADAPHETLSWLGRSLPRREDGPLLRGRGSFIDDLAPFPGMAAAAILRSPHAHARIRGIDAGKAMALPGVRAVLTGAEAAAMSSPVPNALRAPAPYYPIAVDRVRYAGEPVAVVVAEDRYVAEDALDLVVVEYEPLPAVVDPEAALAPDAPILHDGLGGNRIHHRTFRFGDPDGAFSRAARVVSVEVKYPRVMSTPVETYGVIADYDPGRGGYTIWSNFQGPFIGHPLIAGALRVPANRLRMISAPHSGGSFGVKWGVFPYAILTALAARRAGSPVKWIEDRAEHLAASSCSTDRVTSLSGAFAVDGTLLALRVRQLENVGAYLRPPEPSTLYRTHGNLNGPYRVRHIAVENTVVVTNQMPTGLNRGFGGPQYFFPLERLMHEAARELGIDALELRLRNLVQAEEMPFACVSGVTLDGGDYPAVLREAARRADYEELKAEQVRARERGELFGIGIAMAVESSASSMAYVNAALTPAERSQSSEKSGGAASATIAMDPMGGVVVRIPTVPAGQGHDTVIAQIVADELGLAPSAIEVATTIDTHLSDWSITAGNYANRFSGADSTAVAMAARQVAAKLRRLAAAALEAAPEQIELADGVARVRGGNAHIPLGRLAAWTHWNSSRLPQGEAAGVSETATFTPTTLLQPDSEDRVATSLTSTLLCDLAAVRVCRDTGRIDVVKYVTVHDVGRVLNPALVEGQVRGGFAHGFGAATMERITYDGSGNLLTGSFADYLCPTAGDLPAIEIGHLDHPTESNLLGARGLGDGSSMNAPAALANAVADAIGRAGVSLPLTPSRVWSLLNDEDPDAHLAAPRRAATDDGASEPQPRPQGGQLTGTGDVDLPGEPVTVWSALFDLAGLRKVIPGCRRLSEIGPDTFAAEIHVSVAGIGCTYKARIALAEKNEPVSLTISGEGAGLLGHGRGKARLYLAPSEPGMTRLSYRYEAVVGGRVATVGHRMLDGVMKLLIQRFFAGLSVHLSPESAAPRRSFTACLRAALARIFGR